MREIKVETCGDFCEKCSYFELEDIYLGVAFAPNMHIYRCKYSQECSKAIELFAESKGIKVEEEPKEDDWMEDQAL